MKSEKVSLSEGIRVSPRHLGQMRLAKFCPYCYAVSIGMGFKYPFDFGMPGIMHNMDRFEKRLVQAYFDSNGKLPDWLDDLGCTEPIEFPAKMTQEFPKLDLTLVGMPDAIFRKRDGSLCIIDYKTAKLKGSDDPFMPIYETQLWGYAQLAQHYRLGDVSSAALVYFGNTLKDFESEPLDLLTKKGLRVPFEVKIHQVDVDLDELVNLLNTFRKYIDMDNPPDGREGCKNCERVNRMYQILRSGETRHKLVADLLDRNPATMNMLLRKHGDIRRDAILRESMRWENSLTEPLPCDWEYVPGASDLQ